MSGTGTNAGNPSFASSLFKDWEAVKGGKILPDSAPENGDMRYGTEKDGDLPDEDDDNAYQDSDDALPDDEEEAAIRRHPTREGRFDET